MPQDYFSLLRAGISHDRLEAYRRASDEADIELLARYLWNIALCESLYPALQNLEITLRNSIHQSAATHFKNNFWFDDPAILDSQQKLSVAETKKKLLNQSKPTSDVGRIIAELTFGFWTSLFNVRYELILWRQLLKVTFPYMPRHIRTRKTLSTRLNRIRHLRNHVFHHEPIWHWSDLEQQHTELLEVIGWMNPALQDTVRILVDRFPVVYHQGTKPYREQLEGFLKDFKKDAY